MNIRTIPALGDNLVYLLTEGSSAAVIDPGDAEPVVNALSEIQATLELILVTHTHFDHTGGCEELKRITGCRVLSPAGTQYQDAETSGGAVIEFRGTALDVIAVPGHTGNDVAYYSAGADSVFTGDTLFSGGCGRVSRGSAGQMWESLKRLRSLPDRTVVYGGHDYALENMAFAVELEPLNEEVQRRFACEKKRCRESRPLMAAALAEEKRTNPFLRCDDSSFVRALKMVGLSAAEVFAEIRRRKDRFNF